MCGLVVKKKLKKVGAASLPALMLSTAVVPTLARANESSEYVGEDVVEYDDSIAPVIDESVMIELQEANLDSLFIDMKNELNLDASYDDENDFIPETGQTGQIGLPPRGSLGPLVPTPTNPPLYETNGVKSRAAKEAAKKAIKELRGIGPKVWNEKMKSYTNKLPLTAKAKKTVYYYLSYQVLMETLNIVVDFEGTAQDGIIKGLKKMGCPGWLAGIVARGITFFLL